MARNKDVAEIQQMIINAGFPMPRYGADGSWGDEGRVALRALIAAAGGPVIVSHVGQTTRLEPNAFRTWAPDAVPNTLEALEAAIEATPELQDLKVLEDWLGQMWVESGGFKTLTESLNYSVESLKAKFGRHRISLADAEKYGRIDEVAAGRKRVVRPANQEVLANILYGGEWGRKNLGNTQPGDGWRFRGSGVKQITGRANTEASGFTPEELRTDIFKSCLAAANFFVSHGCIEPARRGDIKEVTRLVNGGDNGLADRITKTGEARKVIR